MRLESKNPYNSGYVAGVSGKKADSNPFKRNTPESEEWLCGWEDGTETALSEDDN